MMGLSTFFTRRRNRQLFLSLHVRTQHLRSAFQTLYGIRSLAHHSVTYFFALAIESKDMPTRGGSAEKSVEEPSWGGGCEAVELSGRAPMGPLKTDEEAMTRLR